VEWDVAAMTVGIADGFPFLPTAADAERRGTGSYASLTMLVPEFA
jgi:hypothetical protein